MPTHLYDAIHANEGAGRRQHKGYAFTEATAQKVVGELLELDES